MKKLLLLGFSIILLASCNQKVRYTQTSPEIDTYKKVIDDYKTQNWADMPTHYADTAKIMNNVVKEKAKTLAQSIEVMKSDATMFTWVVSDEEYEMVETDKGETWVNFWGLWKGTMKATNKTYEVPIHITAQFKEGKIVNEHGYWNNEEIVTDMLKATSASTPQAESIAPKE